MSTEHLVRLALIAVAFLGVLGAYVYTLVGQVAGAQAQLEGMLLVLLPAVLDAARVGQRERRRSIAPPASE